MSDLTHEDYTDAFCAVIDNGFIELVAEVDVRLGEYRRFKTLRDDLIMDKIFEMKDKLKKLAREQVPAFARKRHIENAPKGIQMNEKPMTVMGRVLQSPIEAQKGMGTGEAKTRGHNQEDCEPGPHQEAVIASYRRLGSPLDHLPRKSRS